MWQWGRNVPSPCLECGCDTGEAQSSHNASPGLLKTSSHEKINQFFGGLCENSPNYTLTDHMLYFTMLSNFIGSKLNISLKEHLFG